MLQTNIPLKGLLVLLLSIFGSARPASAQQALTEASLVGRVLDPSGAAIAHITVTALLTTTDQAYTAQTDAQGRFRLPYLPVGPYLLSAQAPGLARANQTVQLTVGSAFDLTLRLAMAGANASVQVSAQPPLIETGRSQVGETIQAEEITGLPYEGRNYLDLALLLPGVSPTNTASTQILAETSEATGQGYSVNSQRNFSNSFVVDGLSDNDDAAGVAGNVFGLDVVREFQVVTAGGQAEFGHALGGYFNIVTRSGTNQLHGTVYGFLRNQRLNAYNPLSGSRLPLTQGQYGASLSGPVKKDRTFLFGNFEEQRLNTDGIVTISPANAVQVNARLNAVGYAAPPLPVGSGPTTLYPTTLHTDTLFVRADHRFRQADQFNIRYSSYRLSSLNARGAGGLASVSYGTSVYDTDQTVAVSNIADLSARTFNETRSQFSYDNLNAPPNDEIGPTVSISGVAQFGRFSSSPTARLNYLYEAVDNLVMERGTHTFKTGVDFLFNADTITFPMSLRGSYSFSSLASFLSGQYNNGGYTQNFGTPAVQQNNPNVGFYVQDEWKVTASFVVNAGLRYDLEFLRTVNTDKNNVSPRIGFAWSPYANRHTVVRGSYGLYYDRVPLRPLANALLSAHNTADPNQAALLSYTFTPGQPGAPSFPNVAAVPPAEAVLNYATLNPNIQTPYSQQVSVGIEQQIASLGTLGISYQHLRGLHLIGVRNLNIEPEGSRPDPTRGNVKTYDSSFDSSFDGLEVSLQERPAAWGSARVSYTFSKAMDDVGEFFFSAPINNLDLAEDRSRSDDDQRHRVVFDAALTSSAQPARNWARRVTNGWRLGGILQYYSRLPFNITTGQNTAQQTTQRPCASGSGYSVASGTALNPCTEGLAGAVIGRNAGVGFAFFSLNARLSRTFPLTSRVHLEGIVDAFNTLNHRNDLIPNGTWGTGAYPNLPAPGFGRATAAGDPRSIQVAARISF